MSDFIPGAHSAARKNPNARNPPIRQEILQICIPERSEPEFAGWFS
jgi:hypothetical protein